MPDATAVRRDLSELAPRFRRAVEDSIAECRRLGLDAMVFEAVRTEARQEWLYAQGRTRKGDRVTNARDALSGWHFYGLAVDVISESMQWGAPLDWWRRVAAVFEAHGCDWGGDWTFRDLPHFQWGTLKASPSPRARELYRAGGLEAVWREVGAWEEEPSGELAPPPLVAPDEPPNMEKIILPDHRHFETAARMRGKDLERMTLRDWAEVAEAVFRIAANTGFKGLKPAADVLAGVLEETA